MARCLKEDKIVSGQPFNFGPSSIEEKTVENVVKELRTFWKADLPELFYSAEQGNSFSEAKLLKLNCDKASSLLDWQQTLSFGHTMEYVGEWYDNYYNSPGDNYDFIEKQIMNYVDLAKKETSLGWIIESK